jgi:CBS domain containing-hemolysin-like protein
VLLTLANAFFVVGEFSLVTVDRAGIEQAAKAGDRTARTVSRSLHELSFQLSAAQLGITLAALLTGYLAEPALAHLLRPLIRPWGGTHTEGLTHVAALAVATLFSMLFGELVPKNAALARPMPLVRASAGPLRTFATTFSWRIGVEPHEELATARSPEELGLLAAISARAGAIPADTAVLLRRTIRFGDKRAAEAMTPRVDVSALRSDASVADLLTAAHDTGFSRFPIFEGTLDHVTGVAAVTDALGVMPEMRATTSVATIASEPLFVPDSLDLDGVLAVLNGSRTPLAIVVDEYGGTDGVVTAEDLVEELVGEIADEHDPRTAGDDAPADHLTVPGGDGPVIVDGVLREDELVEQTGFTLPPGPYETLAGFLMAELGHIPVNGETLRIPGWEFTVIEVDKRRIEQVRVAPMEPVE